MYAILSHGGRQYRVSAGDRLVVDRLDATVGSVVALEPVLLTGGDGATALGKDTDGVRVAVTVVAHTRGEKLRVFKYKAKKRSRKVAGYRSDLTELRVDSILARGAALPATAAAGSPASRGRRATAKAEPAAAQTESVGSAAATSAPATRGGTRGTAPKAAAATVAAKAKPKTPGATTAVKPATKRASKPRAPKAEEKRDGA